MSEIREHFIHNRAPPNPPPQQTGCWEDFSVLGITGMAGVRGICMRQLAEISTCPTRLLYMMLPCTSTSMNLLAN